MLDTEPGHVSARGFSPLDGLTVTRGFDEDLAARLVEKSGDQSILKMAPRDASERFSDVQTALDWFNATPGRLFYQLSLRAQLAGAIWFTPAPFEDADYTFAARVYEPFAGHGIGTAFAGVAHRDLGDRYRGAIWADIHIDNMPSLRLAHRLGYRSLGHITSADASRVQLLRPALASTKNDPDDRYPIH